MSYLLRL